MEKVSPLLSNKNFLYATEFFSGMSIMAVELGAARLLAPYFSSSQIVWTIIIGTIMIALALGNVWGGRRADLDKNPAKLYHRLILAALWIGAIPVLGKYLIIALAGVLIVAIDTNLLIWARRLWSSTRLKISNTTGASSATSTLLTQSEVLSGLFCRPS